MISSQVPRIVALAVNTWEGPWMNRQQILSRLACKYPVLYSNGAWSRGDLKNGRWRTAAWTGKFDRVDDVLIDRAPALLSGMKYRRWLHRGVTRVVASRWRRRLRREGHGPLIAYVFHPRLWPYAQSLHADFIVYHAYDLFRLQVGWSDALAAAERALIERADLVIGSSEVICDELRQQGAKNPVHVPNAADFDAFSAPPSGPAPDDLQAIPSPRIGYIGKLSRKVDLRLVAELARANRHWQFVFVGSCESLDRESADGVAIARTLPNIHFLGFKPHTALPAYASRMDVNLICHRVDDALWTKGTFPLKLFEYLASGQPVVSADIPSVLPYRDVVSIARSPEAWEKAIRHGLDSGGPGTPEARQAVARQNTWDLRVAALDDMLTRMVRAC